MLSRKRDIAAYLEQNHPTHSLVTLRAQLLKSGFPPNLIEQAIQEKEKRDTRKQQETQIKQLRDHIEQLQHHITNRQNAFRNAAASYKDSVSDKWEYLQVSSKNVSQWGSLDNLGRHGWELVGISTFEEGGQFRTVHTIYIFKRRIPV